MGNRAVITTEAKEIGVYLHWNGGRDEVEGLLEFCKRSGFRSPEEDCYGWAYLCCVIGCFFGDGCGVGIERYSKLDTDNGDNGVYIIKNWEIVGREFFQGEEQNSYPLKTTVSSINDRMPEHMRLEKI